MKSQNSLRVYYVLEYIGNSKYATCHNFRDRNEALEFIKGYIVRYPLPIHGDLVRYPYLITSDVRNGMTFKNSRGKLKFCSMLINCSSVLELLRKFVNQRAGLQYCNYGDIKSYRREQREITNDLHDFRELFSLAFSRIPDLGEKLTYNLWNTSGRLVLKVNDKGILYLEYITGQYFPTEYRPAACRALIQLIWNDYMNETERNSPNPLYKNGHEIRKAIRRQISRRCAKNYFS